MNCPSCGTKCPENSNFCLHCGTSLKSESKNETHDAIDLSISSETMTQALKRLMPTSYVEKLLASKGRMEGERRVVTILFSDVKGSTTLAENLDPEEVLEIMNGAFNVLIEPITRYEGTLARLMGDAILAFFGAPIAHEDDAYRACRAALEILEGARNYSAKLETEKGIKGFDVRVGMNTGLVVVAEVGTDLRVEYTAMGDAVNIAARMESTAETGTILITEATKKLIQNDFEVLPVGPIQVKGKSEAVNTYRLLDIKKSENIQYLNDKFHSPLIGRENELNKLNEVLKRLHQGTGGIVSIIGDSGIGKSRLVAEICKQIGSEFKWAEGKALTYTINKSYWMIRGLLKNFLGFHQESSDVTTLEILYKRVKTHFKDKVEEIYPYIEYYLKPSGKEGEIKSAEFNDTHTIKGRFHFAVKEFIKKESTQQPIVLVLEDLQWCDMSSLELLVELLPLVAETPILLLFQYRLDENEKRAWNFHHNNLRDYEEKHEVLLLGPLNENECELLIKNLLGGKKLPLEIQNQVIERTEGNPSFLEEVIFSITEGESSIQDLLSSEFISVNSQFKVPSMLQSVIMARVDCLEQQEKTVLQTAAVIGRVFQKGLLVKLVEGILTDSELERSLYELQFREFILRHLPANITVKKSKIEKEYVFKQEVSQKVVYDLLLLSQRQQLHKQIGEIMENMYHKNIVELADTLAFHFEKGSVLAKAIHYNKLAGDRAKEFFANNDALVFYLKALKLSEGIQIESLKLGQIHESMGDVYSLVAEYSKAMNHLNLSLNYHRDVKTIARVFYKCGQIFERWGKYEKSLENYEKGLRLINQEDEKVLTAHIFAGIGMVYYRQTKLAEAEKFNVRALLILKKNGSEVDIADVYNNMGIILCKSGDLEKSLNFYKKCLHIREKFGISGGLAASNNNLGYLYQLKNDFDKATEYYKKSLEYCEKIGSQHGLARIYENLSQIYITQGKYDSAREYNLKAISILGKIAKDGSQIDSDVWLQSSVW
jgi:class 3 adenylate cyclase/tetratricopeptide (TPR) repeat protein/ABC-type dipeptide/oligopeptide/nickel transport system ATPase component